MGKFRDDGFGANGAGRRHGGPERRGPGPGYGRGRGMGWGCGWRARMEGQLRNKGYRFTVPRQVIVDILEENEDYVSAEDLYLQVHERHPGIGLATVYRTLQLLVEIGVVSRIEAGEGKARFQLARENERRRREVLICTNCFRTIPINTLPEGQNSLMERVEEDVHKQNGFEIRQSVLQFYGICGECKQRMQMHPDQDINEA